MRWVSGGRAVIRARSSSDWSIDFTFYVVNIYPISTRRVWNVVVAASGSRSSGDELWNLCANSTQPSVWTLSVV